MTDCRFTFPKNPTTLVLGFGQIVLGFPMKRGTIFSLSRWLGIILKELLQLRRDRMTFAMIIGIPVMQLLLFGYAINTDPKHLNTALILGEDTCFTRSFISALKNSKYYEITETVSEEEAERQLRLGEMQFIVTVPTDFSKRLLRGERPTLLIEADATDPMTVNAPIASMTGIVQSVVSKEFGGSLKQLQGSPSPFSVSLHRRYNPEVLTHINIVPGLMGMVLTMTMVMITAISITRERERGTLENLLASPVTPLEIMTGKIVPFVLISHIQIGLFLLAAKLLFDVPFEGSPLAFYLTSLLFVIASLSVGVTISSFAKNQLQALQMTIFYLLPSLLLSGFLFPFAGMPAWARLIGNILPLTHFNKAVRAILLKGSGCEDLFSFLWPMFLFTVVILAIATRSFRRTLD